MDTVTICTGKYIQEIIDFYYNDIQDLIISEGYNNDEFFFKINKTDFDPQPVIDIMQDIILDKNPIVSGQTKLFTMFKEMIFLRDNDDMCANLSKLVEQSDCLHIDGYIHFRLNNYERILCEMLYSVIKKNLSIEYN